MTVPVGVAAAAEKGAGAVSRKALASYGFMALPLAFAGLPVYLHAPDFYARTQQLPLAALGAVLLALRLVDALQDPLIGTLSDRYHSHRGRIIAIGLLLLGGGFWMLFHPVAGMPLFWFALSILICTTGFSVVSINFQTLGGLWKVTSDKRTAITATREGFGLVGLLIASVAPPALAAAAGTAGAFHWLTLGFLPLLLIAALALRKWMLATPLAKPAPGRVQQSWQALFADRWRGLFFAIVFLNALASSVPAVLVLFFIRDRLGAEAYTGLFLLVYFLSGAIAMPLWNGLAIRLGKYRAWQISLVCAIATFFWAVFLGPGDIVPFLAVCALSGLALGADLALPSALLADHIEIEGREANASSLFAVMALLSKAALAVATGLTLPLLGLAGYQPGQPPSPDTAMLLGLTYAGLPCLLKLLALGVMSLFEKDLAFGKSAV